MAEKTRGCGGRRLPLCRALMVTTALGTGICSPVSAQGERYTNPYTGDTWNNPISSYLDTVIQNQRQQQMMLNQQVSNTLMQQMIMGMELRKVGKQRIAAGKASTRFTPSAQGSQVASLVPDDPGPQERQKVIAANKACLDSFHAAMRRFGLIPYDVADARALAFTMAFTAYQGKDPGPARLKNLRNEFRKAMLNDPMFQAIPDYERQARYEKMVIPAMIAVTARRQSLKPGLDAERREVLALTAERMGENLLKGLWLKPVEAIELSPTGFADRGERIVATGAGQTTFQRSSDGVIVRNSAESAFSQTAGWDEKYYADLLKRFDAAVQEMGLQTNDLADGQAVAAAMVYPVFASGKTQLNQAQVAWLRKEMRKDILSSADFQRMSNSKKQEVYESVALKAMHIRAQYEKNVAELKSRSQKSGDPFLDALNKGYSSSTENSVDSYRSQAHSLLRDIFNPRVFDDYVLVPTGFQKR